MTKDSFIKVPKSFFYGKEYTHLSLCAKILYCLMAERMNLSEKNGWIDKSGRTYIYFTINEAMKALNIGKDKALRVYSELDSKKGCSLIEKKRQGLKKPDIIYVNQPKTEVLNAENTTPLILKNRPLEEEKTDSNNKYINNTDFNKLNHISIFDDVMEKIKENIDYDVLKEKYGDSRLSSLVSIMAECILSDKPYIKIGGEDKPSSLVKDRLLKLDFSHIEYVLDCFYDTKTEPKNIKSYLTTALYNSYTTIDFYYEKKVQKDLSN